jgi:prepilin-type N-terminal cleavage/methylation domain-containing protein
VLASIKYVLSIKKATSKHDVAFFFRNMKVMWGMTGKKGFSLLEIIVVLVIIGIGAAVVLPNLTSSIEQTKAQAAKNNLLAMAAAQEKYFEDNNPNYCTNTGGSPTCGTTQSSLMLAMHLNVSSNDPFTYSCSLISVSCGSSGAYACTGPYCCAACDSKVTLTLNYTAATGSVIDCRVGGNYCPN